MDKTVKTREEIIDHASSFAANMLADAEAGHDYFHALRVRKNALIIAAEENADLLIVELAALLHDIPDSKLYSESKQAWEAWEKTLHFLDNTGIGKEQKKEICNIIENISFSRQKNNNAEHGIEFMIVQDADRLDALGAIGIARTFHYGGYKNRKIYDPSIKAASGRDVSGIEKKTGTSLNHFYEKLLRLKDMMNTRKGREMAEQRHRFMLLFMDHFFEEWNI
jgi:uncharacterized protein